MQLAGSVWIKAAGDYRIGLSDTRSGDMELGVTVLRGSAELRNTHGMTLVRAGTYAAVTASTAPSLPLVSNSAQWDEFDRWVEDQRDGRYGVESVRYLPEEIRYYGGAFDQYGSWDYIPVYGHVWYPRVAVGWRPYYQGDGRSRRDSAGSGLASIVIGAIRRITMDAGDTGRTAGSGFRDTAGRPRRCRGRTRRATSAGARSDSTIVR